MSEATKDKNKEPSSSKSRTQDGKSGGTKKSSSKKPSHSTGTIEEAKGKSTTADKMKNGKSTPVSDKDPKEKPTRDKTKPKSSTQKPKPSTPTTTTTTTATSTTPIATTSTKNPTAKTPKTSTTTATNKSTTSAKGATSKKPKSSTSTTGSTTSTKSAAPKKPQASTTATTTPNATNTATNKSKRSTKGSASKASSSKGKDTDKSATIPKTKKTSKTTPSSSTPTSTSPPRDKRLITVTEETLNKLAPKDSDTTFTAAPETLLDGCKRITAWKQEEPKEDEDCPVCLCPLSQEVVTLSKCTGHSFHQDCIAYCYDKSGPYLKCPICSFVYGTRVGNMPPGTMSVSTSTTPLPGYTGCGTITITYYFANGVQGPEHRFPGSPYTGTSRTCYLPDDAEGKEVLRLLDISFKRRLTFTIGTSVTSGATNTVIWNGIHHKTCTSGGPTNYGYPDPDYLSRVKEELKAVGVE